MKTVMCMFSGEAPPNALLMLNTRSPRGGRSTAKVHTNGKTSLEAIVQAFADDINGAKSEFTPGTGDYRAAANGANLVIMASDAVSSHTYDFCAEPDVGDLKCNIQIF